MVQKYKKWTVNININNQEYIGNELLAKELSSKGYDALIKDYVYIYPQDVKKTLKLIPDAWESLYGRGIDLGSGVGCISSAVALKENVKKIFSLEVVENVVSLCQPIIIKTILKKNSHKVISVIGDFDNLELKGNSLDFAISWFSMHHSNNLEKTFRECLRVLKPGGKFIIIDRAHNNSTPDSEVERMHNIIYNKDFIKKNFRPKGTIITRIENGEHEYRFFEWENFIKKSGFSLITEIVIKTDTPENRKLKNDNNLCEVLTNYELGVFGNRAIGFVLSKKTSK